MLLENYITQIIIMVRINRTVNIIQSLYVTRKFKTSTIVRDYKVVDTMAKFMGLGGDSNIIFIHTFLDGGKK